MSGPEPRITVLALHGNGGGGTRYERVLPHVPADVRFEPATLPGFASVPADPALRTIEDYADHVGGVLASLPRPRVLLGHGIGGSFALDLLSRHPEAAEGLLLHAPVAARLDRRLFPRIMEHPAVRRGVQRVIASPVLRPVWRRLVFPSSVPTGFTDRFLAEYGTCAVFGDMFDLITADWFSGLRPTATPAVLLWGRRDRVLSADQAAAVARLLLNGRTEVVERWGHFPMVVEPLDYAERVAALARALVRESLGAP